MRIKNIFIHTFVFIFLFISICKANDVASNKNDHSNQVSSKNDFDDSEEKLVIDAAKKKARKLGYEVKKYEIHTDFHGHDCTVNFYSPKSDVFKLKVYLRSNNGKVFYVEEFKNSKWVGHK